MSTTEQRRAWVLTKVMAGEVEVAEAAELLGLSVRSVWRLKRRFADEGPAGLVHGNRGRPSPRRIDESTRYQVRALARGRYDGANDSHLAELLGEREGISLSRVSVRRILRAAGIASPRRRRSPRHRSRRDRMAQAGMLLQTDGSRHDWLGERGPRLTLIAAIDDATGMITGATFREQEDVAGYLAVLRETIRRRPSPRRSRAHSARFEQDQDGDLHSCVGCSAARGRRPARTSNRRQAISYSRGESPRIEAGRHESCSERDSGSGGPEPAVY